MAGPQRQVSARVPIRVPGGLFALAAVVGVTAGLGAVGFRTLIAAFTWTVTGHSEFGQQGRIPSGHLPWLGQAFYVVIPMVGGLLYGPLIARWAHEARGSGVPEVMYAVAREQGEVCPRVGIVRATVSVEALAPIALSAVLAEAVAEPIVGSGRSVPGVPAGTTTGPVTSYLLVVVLAVDEGHRGRIHTVVPDRVDGGQAFGHERDSRRRRFRRRVRPLHVPGRYDRHRLRHHRRARIRPLGRPAGALCRGRDGRRLRRRGAGPTHRARQHRGNDGRLRTNAPRDARRRDRRSHLAASAPRHHLHDEPVEKGC